MVEANASKGFIPHEVFRINAFAMGDGVKLMGVQILLSRFAMPLRRA